MYSGIFNLSDCDLQSRLKSKSFCANSLSNFSSDFSEIWCGFKTLWSGECHTHFSLWDQHLRESKILVIHWEKKETKKISVGLCLDINKKTFSKLGLMIDITEFYRLIPVWITLTFIQGHRYGKAKSLIIFLASFSINLDEIWYAAMMNVNQIPFN